MNYSAWVFPVVLILLLGRWAAQLWLARLNQRNVLAHADAVPDAFKAIPLTPPPHSKSVQYTLAKSRFGNVEMTYDLVVLAVVLFSGLLPWIFRFFINSLGTSAWATAAFLFAVGLLLALQGIPFEWYSQFRLEERFGFNTNTLKLWCLDRLKGFLLAPVRFWLSVARAYFENRLNGPGRFGGCGLGGAAGHSNS